MDSHQIAEVSIALQHQEDVEVASTSVAGVVEWLRAEKALPRELVESHVQRIDRLVAVGVRRSRFRSRAAVDSVGPVDLRLLGCGSLGAGGRQ